MVQHNVHRAAFPATIIRSEGTLQARRCPMLVCQQRCMSLPIVFPCFSHVFHFSGSDMLPTMMLIC
uniref:Uncharacterized protein n=1 Tax=Wuchereria bancrofti TaxID=6293 RepID=A0A1I8EGF3_WUCBA